MKPRLNKQAGRSTHFSAGFCLEQLQPQRSRFAARHHWHASGGDCRLLIHPANITANAVRANDIIVRAVEKIFADADEDEAEKDFEL
jgi:hypothetical protein